MNNKTGAETVSSWLTGNYDHAVIYTLPVNETERVVNKQT